MDTRRTGLVFVAAALLVGLLAMGAVAQSCGTGMSMTTTTGTMTTHKMMETTVVTGLPPEFVTYRGLYGLGQPTERITGRVVSVDRFYPAGPSTGPGLVVTLRRTPEDLESIPDWQLSENVGFRTVHLGPAWFVEQNLSLRRGQFVEIIGVPARYHGDDIIIAQDLRTGGDHLALRSVEGRPMWASGWYGWTQPVMLGRINLYDTSTVQTVSGRIERVWNAELTAGMGQHRLVSLRLPDYSLVTVALAPSSFVDHSGIPLIIGDQVIATGSLVNLRGEPILLASQFQEGGRSFALRDNFGNPAWTIAMASPPTLIASTTTPMDFEVHTY